MNKHSDSEEIKRLQTLLSYDVLDSAPEEEFEGLVQLIAAICDVPVAIISMLDERRQWYKAKVGLEQSELPRNETICQYTLLQNEILEISNALEDDRVKDNPFVKAENGIRYYAGISLQAPNGYNIGTLCVADTKPRKLSESQRNSLKLLSRQVMSLLEARRKNKNLAEELEHILNEKIKEAEEKLFLKENEYQHLLESIKRSNSVVEFTPDGHILSTNAIFRSFIGYTGEELSGMHHSQLVDPKGGVKNDKFWQALENGEYKAGRFKRVRKNGEEVWMQATYNPVKSPNGNIDKIIKIAQDITIEIEAEKAMQKAKEAAESLNRQKDSFIANVSHEIRTPIHAVLGFTELLLEQESDPQKTGYLKSVKTAGDNLMFIINDILDLSKIEAGIIQMHAITFKLHQVVQNIFSILHLKAKQKQLKLTYSIASEVPEYLIGDSNRLSQVLLNLLGNALKFTYEGSVELRVEPDGDHGDAAMVKFSVTDSGMGIQENKLEKIFERFSQADDSISRKFGGTGLGLNISRQLVERQNGIISVESKVGKGSRFSFSIPYPAGKAPQEQTTDAAEKAQLVLTPGKILLCEDNELNQRLIEAILKENKYTVDVAGNGKKGIELFLKNDYDLVLMDLQMPEQDGRETTKIIRQELQSTVPIVALTANFLNIERERCLKDGMNDYLSKPFKKEELFEMINRWISPGTGKTNVGDKNMDRAAVSLENLVEMSGGNLEFQLEMVELFKENSQKSLQQMQVQLEKQEFAQISATAHQLKGSFGVIGANPEVLQQLEEGLSPEQTQQKLMALKRQLDDIFITLKNKYPQNEYPTCGR
ncbi:ATP-binding protein [Salinimicrobium sp. CAU 1759]